VNYQLKSVAFCLVTLIVAALPLYRRFWWFDLLTHFAVGMSMTLVTFVILGPTILSVLVLYNITIWWEVFEFASGVFLVGYRDTLIDLVITSVGIACGVGIYCLTSECRAETPRVYADTQTD
jgi:VanZ family protein